MDIDSFLDKHFDSRNLDIRKTGMGRWIDQKVTPDVLSFVADTILNLPESMREEGFTKTDVWFNDYFLQNVPMFFGKPKPDDDRARHEYDKFTHQPIKTLAYSGVLNEVLVGRELVYTVSQHQLLEYIGLHQTNAYRFLVRYITRVLRESGFFNEVLAYVESEQSNVDLQVLKQRFTSFTIKNTKINGTVEAARIFTKVINPLACHFKIRGTKRGNVSPYPINFSDLSYNQVNWRDVDKDKSMTRQQKFAIEPSEPLKDYETAKAMKAVRLRHNFVSELEDEWSFGNATQVHHIFPRSTHPALADIKENLICLTPTQHFTKAHPNNNTKLIDPVYQIECLVAKIQTVTNSSALDFFYSEESMRHVLKVGLGLEATQDEPWEVTLQRLRDVASI